MLITLLLTLALTTPTSPAPCLEVEVTATGRGAHGSAIMPQSAPHVLIRALDRLPGWVEDSRIADAARIVELRGGAAVNIIPRQALAVVDIDLASPGATEALLTELSTVLGPKIESRRLDTPCRPREP